MYQSWQTHKRKNWQWRIIIWSSLFLIFGKGVGQWLYHALAIDQAYETTTSMAKKVGVQDFLEANNKAQAALMPQLIIEVNNDTANEYTIESKTQAGSVKFDGHTFSAGDAKRFIIKPDPDSAQVSGTGDIVFLSAPMAGSNNTTCQEVHTLNFDMKYAEKIKQPLLVNLSSIASKMDCQKNSIGRLD